MPLAAFTDSRHVKAEEAIYASSCKCSQLVEAHRAALHASLERVLVIDIRFRWNGLGNSLERWERLLRVGLAAGRATFLQMSDQQHPLFDLGEHFVAKGADWRWSPATRLPACHAPSSRRSAARRRAPTGSRSPPTRRRRGARSRS